MATAKKRISFFSSEEGIQVEQLLLGMTQDTTYNTEPSYNSNTEQYPNNRISFRDKHMAYLNTHPSVDPNHYIANLRLITRIR